MEIRTESGLAIGLVTTDEAVALSPGQDIAGVDVLRVPDPRPADWDMLRRCGFVPKPAKISWLTATTDSDEEYVAGLPKKERWHMRRAGHLAETDGVRLVVEQPIGTARLDAFLRVYLEQVGRMRYGVPYVTDQYAAIRDGTDPYFAVWAMSREEVVGGCLVVAEPGARFTRIRFSATAERFRDSSLSRIVYLKAINASRARGYDSVTLGSDPNLYGHIVKIGLFGFKRRLGFVPVPSQEVRGSGADEADRVLRLGALEDPAFVLGYPPAAGSRGWCGGWGTFFTARPELDTSSYRTDLMAGVSVLQLPAAPQHTATTM